MVSLPHRGICVEEIHVGIWFPISHFACLRFIPIHSNLSWYYGSCSWLLSLSGSLIALLPAISTLAPNTIIFCMLLVGSFDNNFCLLSRSWSRVVGIYCSPQMTGWLIERRILFVDSIHIILVIVIIITFLREVRRWCPIICVICRLPTMSFWNELSMILVIIVRRGSVARRWTSGVVRRTHREFAIVLLPSSGSWCNSLRVLLKCVMFGPFLGAHMLLTTAWRCVLTPSFTQRLPGSL